MRPTVLRFGAIRVRVSDDPPADIARSLAVRLRGAIRRRGSASLAVSGGSMAPSMLAAFVHEDIDWDVLTIWQVDERIVADGHPARNAEQLWFVPSQTRLMPVTGDAIGASSVDYAAGLPERFDAVHLGIGTDGHTASWPPVPHRDAAVVHSPSPVAIVGDFNGYGRMTLTPGPVNHARARLLLASGTDKASVVRRWIDRDAALPVSRLRRSGTTLFVDPDGASKLTT